MKAPEAKPNMTAKPMATDARVAGIQTANSVIPERVQAMMNMFHLPMMSAPYPEARRPNRLSMVVSVRLAAGLHVYIPCTVEYGHQVLRHLLRHVRLLVALRSQVVDGDEDAIGQDEDADEQHDERELLERCCKAADGHLLGYRLHSRANREDCNDLQSEDDKGASSHGPRVPDARDHAADHDGEDDDTD